MTRSFTGALRRLAACSALCASLVAPGAVHAMAPTPVAAAAQSTSDPFLWLEDAHGDRAMAWVRKENARTSAVLEADPRFATLQAQALKIAQSADRIPAPEFIGGEIYNFWQDADHVRGLWRETSLADYRRATPSWRPVLDLDVLARSEGANWVFKGDDCEWRGESRCLLSLSDGGEDAVTVREFDLRTRAFVADGFRLPKGKQRVAWSDPNTLLVAREWAPGEMTASGYPYVVKALRRGQPLSAAVEVFRGAPKDGGYGVRPLTFHDGDGRQALLIDRPLTTFESETWLVTPKGPRRLGLPAKVRIDDLVAGRLVMTLAQTWTADGATFAAGDLVSVDLAQATADPEHPHPRLMFAPGARESVGATAGTRSRLVAVIEENVRGQAWVFTPLPGGRWSHRRLDLPDNASVGLVSEDSHADRAFLHVTSFLTPPSLWLADVGVRGERGRPERIKAVAAKFDASGDTVDQYEATSTDGTRVPYFVVHPTGMALTGANPTILYAYGGFQVSETPSYSGALGKLWLEHGGVYVLANIRGGGEFGPAWHEAGLKTRRQLIYDDFAAVAKDLIARGVTSPRRLGIEGGSNGGLLMGVEFTQHPELWNAVDIQVPLLDMLRYESIAAGSSWVGEYGSVANPDERAFLAKISPYANLHADAAYPEPLIWTTTKDDRVGPQHARKFAARLAELGKPYFFHEVIEGGHGAGANLEQSAHTRALEYVYFLRKLVD
jgi:prolyl oligopeptidase